jgi:hypothetical protein
LGRFGVKCTGDIEDITSVITSLVGYLPIPAKITNHKRDEINLADDWCDIVRIVVEALNRRL